MEDKTNIPNTPYGEVPSPFYGFKDKNRLTGGLLLLVIGGLLLARQLGAPLPDWLFTWPVILIAVGLFMGLKLRFRNPGWMIPTFIGVVFLADQTLPGVNLKPFIAPIIIMTIGLMFILRPRRRSWSGGCKSHGRLNRFNERASLNTVEGRTDVAVPATDRSDFIDATAVFGGIKKMVLSKNFQGGDITNFMGGSEINLTQADFKGRVRIDTTNIFGGTKLIVPAHWDVQSDVVAVFGGVDDKRKINGVTLDPDKVVVLDGTCLFGGIEITSY